MHEKVHALDENHTWDLVYLPKEEKAVGCKWVIIVKVNLDGFIARLKGQTGGERVC